MTHPRKACCHAGSVEFGDLRRDKARGTQIRSSPGDGAALEGREAGRGVPWYCDLREAPEGEGEADDHFHRDADAGGENDARVGCHLTHHMSPESPTWRANCRIADPSSPPGEYLAVEFQDGDLRTKTLMVTQRRRDLDRFGPQCE